MLSRNVAGNYFSGHILPEIGSLTAMRYLFWDQNRISGTLPKQMSSLTSLTVLSLSNQSISGSSAPQFKSWQDLTVLSIFNNPNLDFDLQLLSLFPRFEHALASNCHITGQLPANLSNVRSLLLRQNYVSGTCLEEMLLENQIISTIDLSGNALSGTLPANYFQQQSQILLHGQRLSGSLPVSARRSDLMFRNLTTFSLARNFVSGDLRCLDNSSKLKTVSCLVA